MAAKYPTIAKVQTIGKSFENRDLRVLTISKGPNNPAIWVDSGIHAREWIAPSMALYIIDQLLENPANSDLLSGLDWHIMPSVNPDGYEYSHTTVRIKDISVNRDTYISELNVLKYYLNWTLTKHLLT